MFHVARRLIVITANPPIQEQKKTLLTAKYYADTLVSQSRSDHEVQPKAARRSTVI